MLKKILSCRKSEEKDILPCWIVIVVLFALTVLLCTTSPINPWLNGESGTDAAVFETIAMYMERGLMPYRDTFDHKGPLIYIINWLGNQICNYQGVWYIETLTIFVTFVVLYKIARFFCTRLFSLIVVVISASSLLNYFEHGNLSEEYALPFIAIALYIFLDYFLKDTITCIRLLICGLCFGGVLLLRPNMIAVWFVFCIAVLIKAISDKNYKGLAEYLLLFIVGALIIILPVIIWLYMNGALTDMLQSYLLFNLQYVASGAAGSLSVWNVFLYFTQNVFVLCMLFCASVLIWQKRDLLHMSYLLCIIMTLIFISMSGYVFSHYGMVLVPLEVYPISAVLVQAEDVVKSRSPLSILVALEACAIIIGMVPSALTMGHFLKESVVNVLVNDGGSTISEKTQQIVYIVEEYSGEDDTITVLGNWNIIYVLTQRMSASKYSYQSPISSVSNEILEEYFADLEESQPAVVIISSYEAGDVQYDRMMDFLYEYNYELLTDEIEDLLVYIPE